MSVAPPRGVLKKGAIGAPQLARQHSFDEPVVGGKRVEKRHQFVRIWVQSKEKRKSNEKILESDERISRIQIIVRCKLAIKTIVQ